MGKVFYADLWGLRKGKYRYLLENDVSTTEWQALEPVAPHFFFVPKELDLSVEYEAGWCIDDLFAFGKVGITSGDDEFFYDMDKEHQIEKVKVALREGYLKETQVGAKINEHLSSLQPEKVITCLYRVCDERYVYYDDMLLWRAVTELSIHFAPEYSNLGLITLRRTREDSKEHFFVTRLMIDKAVISSRDNAYLFPLYLYTTPEETAGGLFPAKEVTRKPNLSPKFIAAVEEKLGLEFVQEGKGDLEVYAEPAEATTFGPEDILHYAYAVFHSPTYRERYAEFLKIDFPRLPLTSDQELFKALAEKGEELVGLHLMESPVLSQLITSFPVPGSNEVERVRYNEPTGDVAGRVYINKTQYFEGIESEVWEFRIGGYQVLQKWLKDRKGRKLSFDDLFHYQKIVVALKETKRLMREIDGLIPSWPIE